MMTELDAYGKQILKRYDVYTFHSKNGKRYLELCSELKRVLSEADINLTTSLIPKLIDIIEFFVRKDESFLSFIESKVTNPSGGQRNLCFEDYNILCRLYAILIVEEGFK